MSTPNEDGVEQAVVEAALTAPRLTPSDIDACIADRQYHVFEGSQLTVCCITLRNGFTVTGESACFSPENFNERIGKEVAYTNARQKIWTLEGYLLRERLHARR